MSLFSVLAHNWIMRWRALSSGIDMSEFQVVSSTVCGRCGAGLSPGDLVCPVCGQFVHLQQLMELSGQAQAIEASDPAGAAGIWLECLKLIPPDSQQAMMLRQ